MALSSKEVDTIVDAVVAKLQPQAQAQQPTVATSNMDVTDIDPTVTAFYNAEAKLIEELGTGGQRQYLRTKRGITPVNVTEDALNALYDFGRDRKIFTRNRQIR